MTNYPIFSLSIAAKSILLWVCFCYGFHTEISAQLQSNTGTVIMDKPGYPLIFELNIGEHIQIRRSHIGTTLSRSIKLLSFNLFTEPNLWFADSGKKQNYYEAEIQLEISGKKFTLKHRPYQMPALIEGLRIYIENIKSWDEDGIFGKTGELKKQVRIAVCLENETWGPVNVQFPIDNYLWRSAVYNNTWSGVVPFNLLYYHRGEDFGAIPDLMDVVSPVDGLVRYAPLPNGDTVANDILIENADSLTFDLAHMDIENIPKTITVGSFIKAGSVIGKTGMSWGGAKSQYLDPHLHVELSVGNIHLASFPYLMEAYLRKYNDQVVAIAGGYRFTITGKQIQLDGTRSLANKRSGINKTQWKLSDGRVVNAATTNITYDKPGIYSEELTVETKDGHRDKDFLYVKVYDPLRSRNKIFGWAYYYPVRNIKPGDSVLFWNRLSGTTSDVKINFGDDPLWKTIAGQTNHLYKNAGEYVVTLRYAGKEDEVATLKLEVIVNKK